MNILCQKHEISQKADFMNYIKNKIGSHPGVLKQVDIFKYNKYENSNKEMIKIKNC